MSKVTRLPTPYKRKRLIGGYELYQTPEPTDEMVWEMCPYTKHGKVEYCYGCPKWEEHPDLGTTQKGCYAIAAEACRIIFAMQRRQANSEET